MIKQEKEIENIDSIANLFEILDKLKENHNIVFRGHSNFEWNLIPPIWRKKYQDKLVTAASERRLLSSWIRYAKMFLEKIPDNQWDWLALSRHYGLDSRLLDWSRNPLIALYFACKDYQDLDGTLYISEVINYDDSQLINSPFEINEPVFFIPSAYTSRIINQRGLFLTIPHPENSEDSLLDFKFLLKKYRINKNLKEDIIKLLELFRINEFQLYNDLNSLSTYLNYKFNLAESNKLDFSTCCQMD